MEKINYKELIGKKIKCKLHFQNSSQLFEEELVDVIPAYSVPDIYLIIKYYGKNYPLIAATARRYDRLVLRRSSGSYVIIPANPRFSLLNKNNI